MPVGYTPAAGGCTACGSPVTVTVCGVHGRRCAAHPPTYQAQHTTNLLADGRFSAAWAYLRGSLAFPRPVTS